MGTIVVNTTNDSNDGTVTTTSPTISLRDAIVYAEANPGTTIDIPAGTFKLGSDLPLISQSTMFVGSTSGKTIIDGQSTYRGFLVSGIASDGQSPAAITVGISNVEFQNTVATGGAGSSGGGGGLGAGGAIFVGPAASVTLTNVGFSGAEAIGGAALGPSGFFGAGGGGGGLAGASGAPGLAFGGGGGGLLAAGGSGGSTDGGGGGGGGITAGGGTGADTTSTGGAGGTGLSVGGTIVGGGGGGSGTTGGAMGGKGALAGAAGFAGNGGFGGGGGGSAQYAGNGGFGGGGGGNTGSSGGFSGESGYGGNGGFGGGGGGSVHSAGGAGGFGGGGGGGTGAAVGGFAAGSGGGPDSGGGGGALGGAVFVAAGGTLTIDGPMSESGGAAVGGSVVAGGSGGAGTGFGAGIFYEGGPATAPSILTFGSGDQTIDDAIADLDGASDSISTANGLGGTGGVVALAKTGTDTLTLSGDNSYTGGTTIDGGTVDDAPGTANDDALGTGAVTFGTSGSTETLELASNAQPASQGTFGNTLDNFYKGYDQLDLANLQFTNSSLIVGSSNGTETLIVNENNTVEDFTLGGQTAGSNYAARSDGAGGTLVYVICFASGTRIRTRRGEEIVDIAVEDLQVGERVVTASGAERPIRWLGHRTIDCRRHPSPRDCRPIRVKANAFGENRPSRDLFLSPGHSVCVDFFGETLVPVGRLANGATIAQVEAEAVTYWHVELDAHDIILAENLPCESYVDCGTRTFFAESHVVDLGALPDTPVLTTDDYCRPFHPEGALVDFARERLSLRANDLGWQLACADPLAGLWLEVDGQRVVPHCDGLVARITLPAAVRDIRLCSDAAVPATIHGARDERRLGLQLAALVADDGLHWRREMSCTDERLVDGFHPHEGTLRWTDGRARLPSELWAGARDMFVLRLAFAGPALPKWVAPAAQVVEVGTPPLTPGCSAARGQATESAIPRPLSKARSAVKVTS